MTASLLVRDPGLFATIQDSGRWDYLKYGVSNSGVMDRFSQQVANMLVGNAPDEAVIEFTAMGGTYEAAVNRCRVAVVGGDFPLSVDGIPAAPYASHTLDSGSRLEIGYARSGIRGYLSVSGGFDLTPTLGSLSTHIRFKLGGLDGKALAAGDQIPLRKTDVPDNADRFLDAALIPTAGGPIRVVMGPQEDFFTREGIETFLSSEYRITNQSDRMGFRLDGPEIKHAGDFNIVSDGIAAGSIQVPGNRLPIVLMADRQTTGGYPKIATVITADLHRLAQMGPGQTVRFKSVSVEAAEDEYLDLIRCLDRIAGSLQPADAESAWTHRLLAANLIDGVC